MGKVTVLAFYDRISVFHTLVPFLLSCEHDRFDFTDDPAYCLTKDRNRVLFMIRFFLKPDRVDLDLLRKLREKYTKIIFFNGNAGGGIPRLEVLPYVDYLFNKALFRDRSLYLKPLYGGELFSDFYHRHYGVADPDHRDRAVVREAAELGKLRLSWNIGVGSFPRRKLLERAGVALVRFSRLRMIRPFLNQPEQLPAMVRNKGSAAIHARIDLAPRPSIAFQRKLILEEIRERQEYLVGMVPQRIYNREIGQSKITLSPFGWGELCLRDFEAVLNGSLLLKPDMSHLETWPDIFIPNHTYVPFDWNASDLIEKGQEYLQDTAARERIVRQGYEAYRDQVSHSEDRVREVLELIE